MNEIVTGVLFIYPGALIEILYRRYAKYGYKEDTRAEPIHMAELFFYSAVITIFSVLLLRVFGGVKVDTLSSLVFELNRFSTLIQYLILSVTLTIFVAWIRYEISGMDPEHEEAVDQQRVNGCRVVGAANTWRDLIYGPLLQDILEHCILRISCGGQVTAGFAAYIPTDFEQGIELVQTAFVEKRFKEEENWTLEQCNIGEPYAVYIDTPTGIKVEFFDGRELYDYLES